MQFSENGIKIKMYASLLLIVGTCLVINNLYRVLSIIN